MIIFISNGYSQNSNDWEAEVNEAIDLADSSNCVFNKSIEFHGDNIACIELLINLDNALYSGWNESILFDRKTYLNRKYALSKVDEGVISSNFTKLTIVDLLGQLHSNGDMIDEVYDMLHFVRGELHSDNPLIRKKAIRALGFIGDAEDKERLISFLENSSFGDVTAVIDSVVFIAERYCLDKKRFRKLIKTETNKKYFDERLLYSKGFLKCDY